MSSYYGIDMQDLVEKAQSPMTKRLMKKVQSEIRVTTLSIGDALDSNVIYKVTKDNALIYTKNKNSENEIAFAVKKVANKVLSDYYSKMGILSIFKKIPKNYASDIRKIVESNYKKI